MLPKFFINRPIFAWVVAIFVAIAGVLALPQLPIAQYPNVAPPQLSVFTSYAGASPSDVYQSVTQPIEQQLNTVQNVLYFESTSDSTGLTQITVTFRPGTDLNQASVDVQNAIKPIEPLLPAAVSQQGIQVTQSGAGFLMLVGLVSDSASFDAV